MKRAAMFITAFLIASAALGDTAERGPAFRFQTIDGPAATATTAFGIAANRDVVGVFTDSSNRQHGFRFSRGEFMIVDYPGAALTAARGIAPNGDIVGTYRGPGEPAVNVHGFLLSHDGVFSPLDYRGRINTIAQRILPGGEVLGCRHDRDTMASMRGVVMAGGDQSELDMEASMHNGATPDLSIIAGLYTDMEATKGRAYMIVDGEFTPFDYPGAAFTAAWDVSPSGAVVGVYQESSGAAHGFLLQDGEFHPIDFPEALDTRAFGINARGDIVGNYVDTAKRTHAFIARRIVRVPEKKNDPFVR
jgi:probable HAF family extracellular repeat protein